MSLPDYSKVKKEVQRILDENSIISPPISPIEIADTYGIKIQYGTFDDPDISGYINFDEKTIYVNSNDSFARRNFTVAHELGHYFLHREIYKQDNKKHDILYRAPIAAAHNFLEQEANAFAANLLVPKKFLDQYVDIATTEQLATAFAVSAEVIRNRIKSEYKYGNEQ